MSATTPAISSLHARSLSLLTPDCGWTVNTDAVSGSRSGIATRDLPAGSQLIHEQATGYIVKLEMKEEYCAWCTMQIVGEGEKNSTSTASASAPSSTTSAASSSTLSCTTCHTVCYCSPTCFNNASPSHSLICTALSRVNAIAEQSSSEPDLIRLVMTIVGRWMEEQLKGDTATVAIAETSSTTSTTSSTITHPRWQHVQDLISHHSSAESAWLAAITSAMKLVVKEFEGVKEKIVKEENEKNGTTSTTTLQIPDLSTLIHLCCRINSNSHALFDNSSSSNRILGLGLFPTTSILNHSCHPNSFFSSSSNGRMVVRTIRSVRQGEELTVPYIDLYQSRYDRQLELWKEKHFMCACERCTAETNVKVGGLSTAAASTTSAASITATSSSASTPSPATSAASSTSSPSSSIIDLEQLSRWLQVGAIYCPKCLAKYNQSLEASASKSASAGAAAAAGGGSDDWLDDEEGTKGKKKSKRKLKKVTDASAAAPTTATVTATVESITNSVAAASISASSSPATAAASSSSTSSSFHLTRFLIPLPPLLPASSVGLVVWRGSTEEIRVVAAASVASSTSSAASSSQPKSYQCLRSACGSRFTSSEIDSHLSSLYRAYSTAMKLKRDRKFTECLTVLEKIRNDAEKLLPPYHVMYMLTLMPSMNISLHLERWFDVDSLIKQILTRMHGVFPREACLPEISDFVVNLAENCERIVKEMEEKMKKNKAPAVTSAGLITYHTGQIRSAYAAAFHIRSIACGPQHPRTLALPEEYRREKK